MVHIPEITIELCDGSQKEKWIIKFKPFFDLNYPSKQNLYFTTPQQ